MVIVLGGLILFFGLAFLMLRRRNEMLQIFLTPEEPDLEQNFFRVRNPKPEETPPEDVTEDVVAQPKTNEPEEASKETASWGTSHEEPSPHENVV